MTKATEPDMPAAVFFLYGDMVKLDDATADEDNFDPTAMDMQQYKALYVTVTEASA